MTLFVNGSHQLAQDCQRADLEPSAFAVTLFRRYWKF
jgi:hypothetical protein